VLGLGMDNSCMDLFQQGATPTLTPTNDYNTKTRLVTTLLNIL